MSEKITVTVYANRRSVDIAKKIADRAGNGVSLSALLAQLIDEMAEGKIIVHPIRFEQVNGDDALPQAA